MSSPAVLDPTKAQEVSYCIPLWLRDEQIRLNTQTVPLRFEPVPETELRTEPIAVVCYGPSLNETWEQIRDFQYRITCSGAHKFMVERGVIPTWHVDVDPRIHKIALIGEPHPDVEYLLAATCHPKYFQMLVGGNYRVKLWHVFDGNELSMRELKPGEWAITGGCSVGLRAITLARMLGFRNVHVFGMDGSSGASGKHAAAHPNQAPQSFETVYGGVTYQTTPAFLEAARQTFHELDQLKDVRATFHGEGLVQHMARDYKPKHPIVPTFIAFNKPELISAEYVRLNQQLHRENLAYGVGGGRHAPIVLKLVETTTPPIKSVLDYGAGKGYLAKELPFPIWEYDPAFPDKADSPRPADLVVCADVLEHIEPDKLLFVLDDLKRCVKRVGYFVIHTGPAVKKLPDGRNTHLIQEGEAWWRSSLEKFFAVADIKVKGPELHVIVGRRVDPVGHLVAFASLQFRRDPYPIGVATDVLNPTFYQMLCDAFPDVKLFKRFSGDEKFSLSERNEPEAYAKFIEAEPWATWHRYIKGDIFIDKMKRVLKAHKLPIGDGPFTSRWEFSLLPSNGGRLRPHRDLIEKVATLVIGLPVPEWQAAWGGGTDVLKPTHAGELVDYQAPLSEFEVVHTYPHVANQCVVFVRSDKSWHSVGPIQGPAGHWRRTLTVNVEQATEKV